MPRLVCRCDAPLGLATGAPGPAGFSNWGSWALLLGARTLLGAPSLTTDAPLGL